MIAVRDLGTWYQQISRSTVLMALRNIHFMGDIKIKLLSKTLDQVLIVQRRVEDLRSIQLQVIRCPVEPKHRSLTIVQGLPPTCYLMLLAHEP
jgi:hypothetical protein